METDKKKLERFVSLDAFRGLTIAAMVMVNNPGTWAHVYGPLRHASWNGLTPTDLVFPFFLFIVGVSIAFSLKKRIEAGVPRSTLRNKVIVRAISIYLVGLLLPIVMRWVRKGDLTYWPFHDLESLRYVGVLARIALVFLICGLLFIYTNRLMQVVTCVGLLVGYFVIMTMVPMPNYEGEGNGKGFLEPGYNYAAWADSYLVPGRCYWNADHPHKISGYNQAVILDAPSKVTVAPELVKPWDPEGVFSTIPAVASGLIGIFAGLLLIGLKTQERKALTLFFSGFLMIIGGYFWSLTFPVNKSIWTSSYVLLTSGLACTVLAACVYVIDICGRKRFFYFAVVFGSNAIFIFCLSAVIAPFFYAKTMPFFDVVNPLSSGNVMSMLTSHGASKQLASFAYALFFVAINFIPTVVLYWRKIYIRL